MRMECGLRDSGYKQTGLAILTSDKPSVVVMITLMLHNLLRLKVH